MTDSMMAYCGLDCAVCPAHIAWKNDDDQLRPFVNLFLDEEHVNQLQGLETPLTAEDTALIIPAIAGG